MRVLLCCSLFAFTGCATVHPEAIPPEPPSSQAQVEPSRPLPVEKLEPKVRRSEGTITRAELVAVLDAAPGRFLQHVETEPRFSGGRFTGWRLASFFPGDERFAAVDLQPGDVVLTVNGRSIEKPDQLMAVWESLRREQTLIVVVERGGVPRQLRYEILD